MDCHVVAEATLRNDIGKHNDKEIMTKDICNDKKINRIIQINTNNVFVMLWRLINPQKYGAFPFIPYYFFLDFP